MGVLRQGLKTLALQLGEGWEGLKTLALQPGKGREGLKTLALQTAGARLKSVAPEASNPGDPWSV